MKNNKLIIVAVIALTVGASCSTGNSAEVYKVADKIPAGVDNQNECLSFEQKAAFNTRVLQTELMEGALSCPELKNDYNGFVKKYKAQLIEESKELQAYFKKVYGPLADAEMNRFVTKMANDTSEVNFGKQQHGFCTYTGDKFERLKAVKPADFAKFAVNEKSEVAYKTPGCRK